jgi:hypothetical protein
MLAAAESNQSSVVALLLELGMSDDIAHGANGDDSVIQMGGAARERWARRDSLTTNHVLLNV